MQLGNPLFASHHANECVLFILVKLAFVALLSGAVWVDGSSPVFIIKAASDKQEHPTIPDFDLVKGRPRDALVPGESVTLLSLA